MDVNDSQSKYNTNREGDRTRQGGREKIHPFTFCGDSLRVDAKSGSRNGMQTDLSSLVRPSELHSSLSASLKRGEPTRYTISSQRTWSPRKGVLSETSH